MNQTRAHNEYNGSTKLTLETGNLQQHTYIHTYMFISLIHHKAIGCETNHSTPYMTNVQSAVNIVSQ
jgi:hypothetical protein